MVADNLQPPGPPEPVRPDARYVLHFKDEGQDFLRWVLDAEGRVLRSELFQTWLWKGYIVANMRQLLVWKENDDRHPNVHAKPHAYVIRPGDATGNQYPIIHPVVRLEILS